jgi:hypothetical protein
MENLVRKVYELKRHEYVYKKKASGALSSHFKNLVDAEEGSSASTYRRIQMEKLHLPMQFWRNL